MVAIFTGLGAGFQRGSAADLGDVGLLGNGIQGRGGDNVSVNAANGNLLINRRDEFLVGRGPDVGVSRTYNSRGTLLMDDNHDRWQQSTDRRVYNSIGTVNTIGSTVMRMSGDGSEIQYTYRDIGGETAYWTEEGSGRHDKLEYAGSTWTWTDGDTLTKELYFGVYDEGLRIREQIDTDGNKVTFTYDSTDPKKLTKITTADGGYLKYTWSNDNITSIETYADGGATKTLTRTRYAYDAYDRLIKVTTDLTPENNVAVTTGSGATLAGVQNESYVTTYTYVNATTDLIASITQTDGSKLEMEYDGQWRVTSLTQTVASGDIRVTRIGYGANITAVTDPLGSVTRLWHNDEGQLLQIMSPPPEVGDDAAVTQFQYDSAGNVIRTINTTASGSTIPNNLVDASDWGEGEFGLRGENLVDDNGWPQDVDTVPTGDATVAGWNNAYSYREEASWTSTLGPYGEQVVSMHAGQLDVDGPGGGGVTNGFDIDTSKSYEFTYYFKVDALNKHRTYFGLLIPGGVKYGHTNNTTTNPYFRHLIPSTTENLEADKWYKMVGYVLPEDQSTESYGSYGGIYSTETGEKVSDVTHFRWLSQNAGQQASSRFFNHYETQHQGQYTHFYKPEVREVSGADMVTEFDRLDIERDSALLETTNVDGWINHSSYSAYDEARWTEAEGPNGARTVVLETGQFDPYHNGGGNFTNNFEIDGSKTYKFTQYVRKTDLLKHHIYFGLKQSTPAYVKYGANGVDATNPYFYAANAQTQQSSLSEDTWYKIVSYILPEGSANRSYSELGGVFDTETGAKIADAVSFRWHENRPDNTVFARFFNYYDQTDHGWSTQWGAPEVVEIDNAALDQDSASPFGVVYDEAGEITQFLYDASGNVRQVIDPLGRVTHRNYDAAGNLIRTIQTESINGRNPNNLIDASDWGGGEAALRGSNLINDNGWPTDIDNIPSGDALVDGWQANYSNEAEWAVTAGPYGEQIVSMNAGQSNSTSAGGGARTNSFTIDGKKNYEFTYYLRADQLDQHQAYFGIQASAGLVKNGSSDTVNQNPYFTYAHSNAASGIEEGKWYKVVGYVLSEDAGTSSVGSYGGVYDTQTGAKVRDINHFRWNENRTTNSAYSRFFNFYNSHIQGKYTHFYKPEVREVSSTALMGENTVLDVVRDATFLNTPEVNGWGNGGWYVRDGEARWSEVQGPSGDRIVALQTGQFDQAVDGGGHYTSHFEIDGSQAYQFTQYVRKADLTNHDIYFGLSANAASPYVKYSQSGSDAPNPYFLGIDETTQLDYLDDSKWYKIVGYVLPEGSANQNNDLLGGVFDTETGEKVLETVNFRWHENRSDDNVQARFFTYYGETYHGWTTQWAAPEVLKIPLDQLTQSHEALFAPTVSAVSRYVYDTEQHLRYAISAEGHVTEYIYHANGQLYLTKEYAENGYTAGSEIPTEEQMNSWRDGLADRSHVKIFENRYDARGNLIETVDWSYATPTGGIVSGNSYTHTLFTRDASGQLLSRRNASQLAETFSYDGMGRLISSSDIHGGSTTITFNDAASTTTISTSTGHTTTSTYNNAGDLISTTNSGTYDVTGTSSYQYDKNGRLRVVTEATGGKTYFIYDRFGNKTAEVDASGFVTEYQYDDDGQLIASARYTRYKQPNEDRYAMLDTLSDPNNTLTVDDVKSSADPATNFHSYDVWQWMAYDEAGQVTHTVLGDGSVTTYAYDSAGQLVKTYSYFNKLNNTQLASLRDGAAASSVQPAADVNKDAILRTFYDLDGRVIGSLNGEGHLSQSIYDKAGQKIRDITFANETLASLRATGSFTELLASFTHDAASDISVRYVYNGQGQLRFTIDALNQVTEFVYGSGFLGNDLVRQTISYAAPIGTLTSYTDSAVESAVAPQGSSSLNRTSWAVYNNRAQLMYAVDASGAVTGFKYDSQGNVIKSTQYANLRSTTSQPSESAMNSWAASNGTNSRITRNYYASSGLLRYVVDAEGYVTRRDYDAENRIYEEYSWSNAITVTDSTTIGNVASANKGTWVVEKYRYQANGMLSSTYDANGNQTLYQYYANGEQAWEIRNYDEADNRSRSLYINDAAGRAYKENHYSSDYATSEANGTLYYYDGLGNLTRKRVTSNTHANQAPEQNTYFAHDKNGQVIAATDAEGSNTSFTYDAFGNVATSTDARGHTTTFTYDQANRLIKTVDALGHATDTSYTVFGEVESVTRAGATTHFTYDKLGRVLSTTDAMGGVESYTLNAQGQRVTVTNKLTGVTTHTYDKRGQHISSQVTADVHNNSGTVISSTITTSYSYDSRGNRVQMIEADGLAEQRTTDYTYDAADRLIETKGGAVHVVTSSIDSTSSLIQPTESYIYDNRGNMIEKRVSIDGVSANDSRTLYFYDRLDRVTHQISAEGTLTRNFYDANSNLVETHIFATKEALPGDALGTPPAGSGEYRRMTFVYDKLNRMTDSYVHDVQTASYGSSFSSSAATQDLRTQYVYDANGNVIRTIDPNGNSTYSYYDDLNRKTHQVDADGYLTKWSYDANGNVTQEIKYAQQPTGTISTSSYGTIIDNLPSSNVTTALQQTHQDRVTDFTYDLNGRRIRETRQNALTYNGNGYGADNGFAIADSTIEFEYNALGQVTKKIEATDEYINYVYDDQGRMTTEWRSGYTDFVGQSVTPTVDYFYNGLNDLARTSAAGWNDSGQTTPVRTTQYFYSDGGQLDSMIDAEGFRRYYRYDAAGRTVREQYTRQLPSGTVEEGIGYTYDLEGRIVEQGAVKKSGSSWTKGGTENDTVHTLYTAFGEVSHRGMNGIYAERFYYDNAGRLGKTNTGDGSYKFFMYDQNGNQTLAVTSDGTDLSGYSTLDSVLDLWGSNRANVGTTDAGGVNATITKYDARGMAIEVREPQREHHTAVGAPTKSDLTTARTYNAFGDVTSETDARGYTIDYAYNTMGRRIKVESPGVSITNADGSVTNNYRPTEYSFYDNSGRLRATKDANGNLTKQYLLSGTGYNGSEALVRQVIAADGGVTTTGYDIHGNARKITDPLGRITTQTFDNMGRTTQINHAGGLIDTYEYDGLGQQIKHWNNVVGSGNAAKTVYDQQGRVISQTALGGDVTTTAFEWNASGVLSNFGGWIQTTTFENSKSSEVYKNVFGRTVQTNNLSNLQVDYTYDIAGRLTDMTGAGTENTNYTYLNTGKLASTTIGAKIAVYGYDKAGNLTLETLKQGSTWLKNSTAEYDALGRMTDWDELAISSAPEANINFFYDANGNVRRKESTFKTLNAYGAESGTKTHDNWYAFDNMNRVVITKGDLEGGQIVRGARGTEIAYDAAGQRKFTISDFRDGVYVDLYEEYQIGLSPIQGFDIGFDNVRREDFSYDDAGRLTTVKIAEGAYDVINDNGEALFYANGMGPIPDVIVTAPTGEGVIRSLHTYDFMGRQLTQRDFEESGNQSSPVFHRIVAYNAKSQITTETTHTQRPGNHIAHATNTYSYGTGASYTLGSALTITSVTSTDNGASTTGRTTNNYIWRDGAVASSISYDENINQSGALDTTTHTRDASGHLTFADINDGRSRDVTFTNDINGQVLRRDELDYRANNGGDPHEVFYRFGGNQMGYVGNNGTINTDYGASITNRESFVWNATDSGAFRNGYDVHTEHADFDQNYNPLNSYSQGSAGGAYTVRSGDTLQGIAAGLYGDSSLWYKIAQANGLSGERTLTAGQTLNLPVGVTSNTHNANSIKPYDPSAAIGDLSPTTPEPPKEGNGNKCGVFGAILLVVIAVAVTVVTAGAAAAALAPTATAAAGGGIAGGISALAAGTVGFGASVAAGVVGGAVGSIVSQGVGVMTGIQEKFSWKGVALAALGGGISGGISSSGVFSSLSKFGSAAAGGATSSAITQGIGVATGLQDSFSWVGVAAAGIGAGVLASVSAKLPGAAYKNAAGLRVAPTFANQLASGAAGALANAATRSALDGSNFGDNIIASIPDVVGSAIGNLIGNSFAAKVITSPVIKEPTQQGYTVPATHVSLDQGKYILNKQDPIFRGDIDVEIIVSATKIATATFDDVVSAIYYNNLNMNRGVQSGRSLQTLDQSYRLAVSGHNAQIDLNDQAISRINSMRGTLQSGLEISKYPDLVSHDWFGDYGQLDVINRSIQMDTTSPLGAQIGDLIVGIAKKAPSFARGGLAGLLFADDIQLNLPTLSRVFSLNSDIQWHNAFELPKAIASGKLDGISYKSYVSGSDVRGKYETAFKIAKVAGNVLDIGEGFHDTYSRTKNGEDLGFVAQDELFEFGGKAAGGYAGASAGATIGLACGPAAVICSPVLAIGGAIGGSFIGGEVGGDIKRHDGEISKVVKYSTLAGERIYDVLGIPYSVQTGRGY